MHLFKNGFLIFMVIGFCLINEASFAKADKANLSSRDKSRYQEIFKIQEKGDWEGANLIIQELEDKRLMGHVLKQKYLHPTSYRSKYQELKEWLDLYNDHAGADEIFRLAMARKSASALAPQAPRLGRGLIGAAPSFTREQIYVSHKKRNAEQQKRADQIKDAVAKDLKCCGAATRALERLETEEAQQVLDPVEIDILKGRIANTYFFLNRPEKAYKTASEAAERSSTKASLAAWIAGLSAWQLKNYESAAKYFEISARSPAASGWVSSASAFWTSRAYLRIRQPQKVNQWLLEAAKEPRTFYGLIARRTLGIGFQDFNWNAPKMQVDEEDIIKKYPAGLRALLLLDVGQKVLAEQELMQIHPKGSKEVENALLSLALDHRLPALLMRMSTAVDVPNGGYYDLALYPLGWWDQNVHHQVDSALVHALIRQESRFDPYAYNPSGATGLMQILPSTANFISKENYTGKNRYKLLDPATNVELGEKYIRWLLELPTVEGDLFKTIISYNAGPGNMARWFRQIKHENDPLLYIESIPVEETRVFVEKVMTNYWIYRLHLKQNSLSLDMVVEGKWPHYKALD